MALRHRVRPGQVQPRRDRDAYTTPYPHAQAICRRLSMLIPSPSRIVEPSAGSGSFVRAAKVVWPESMVMAVDLHEKHHADLTHAGATSYVIGDWLKQDVAGFKPDLILGNPPFSLAEAHIGHALGGLEDGKHLAFLLPVTFLCGQKRARSMWTKPSPFGGLRYFGPIAQRPSFSGGGTDMVEYGIFIWERGFDSFPALVPHIWTE